MTLRRRHLGRWLPAVLVAIAAATVTCYRPTRLDCTVRCDPGRGCPSPLTCIDGWCSRSGSCAALDGGSDDAAGDGVDAQDGLLGDATDSLAPTCGRLMDLGTISADQEAEPYAINDAGLVVGTTYPIDSHVSRCMPHAFTWNGMLRELVPTGIGAAVNRAGQIAGATTLQSCGGHAMVWTNGMGIDLGTLGGPSSAAVAINDLGQVVGQSNVTALGTSHAFFWERGAPMQDLGSLADGSEAFSMNSVAVAINGSGQVVGTSDAFPTGESVAVLWEAGTHRIQDLWGGTAIDINDAGQIIGQTSGSLGPGFLWEGGAITRLIFRPTNINASGQITGVFAGHAVMWQAGVGRDLGTLGGDKSWPAGYSETGPPFSHSRALSDAGEIVGGSETELGVTHAFYWAGDSMRDLGTLGGTFSIATGINNAHQVIGYSNVTSGVRDMHAFVYTPCPRP